MDVVEVGVYGAIGAFLEQPPLVVEAESLEKLVKVLNSVPPFDELFPEQNALFFERCSVRTLYCICFFHSKHKLPEK